MEYRKYSLGELAVKIFSGGTPSTKNSNYWNGEYNWLSSGETSNDFVIDTNSRITQLAVKESSTKLAEAGDVLIASAGQGKTRGQTSFLKIDSYINQSIIAIRSNNDILNNLYLYYNLKSRYDELRWISDSTSTRGSLTTKILKEFSISIPDLHYQKAIANILYSLDYKIIINDKIIENLEEQAQAIFKSWFVDFEPFQDGNFVESELGLVPEGWEVKELGEFFPVKTGKKNANIAIKDGEYPFFTCSQDISFTDDYSYEENSILLAGNGDFNVKRFNGKFEAYQRTYILTPYDEKLVAFLYNLINYFLPNIVSGYKGSVINYITKGMIEDFQIVLPSDLNNLNVIDVFNAIDTNVSNLKEQNDKLAQTRDTLLPKLMSGEIDVSNIKIDDEDIDYE